MFFSQWKSCKSFENVLSQKVDYSWIPTSIHAPIPLNAILAGHDSDGSRIFVGRTYFQGDQIPCKIIPGKAAAFISNNGAEHYVGNYFEVSIIGDLFMQS